MKLLISLFDYTGNASQPYRENGWQVIQVDIQLGINIMTLHYQSLTADQIGIIAMVPCTDYAVSGARHFKEKDIDGRTTESQKLVDKTKEIIEYFDKTGKLLFWQIENPKTRLHKLNPWVGPIVQKFNPCDFAGYDPIPNNSRYNKETWLFGRFNKLLPKRMEPLQKDNPGWKKYGGKSLKTKNERSITPLGFAYAFYESNH
jgi:hypothetical protein